MATSLSFAGTTPPTTTYTRNPASPNGKASWYTSPVTITFTATDLTSGVSSINYRLNNEAWQTVSFSNTLNLAPNPSFEDANPSSNINTTSWKSTLQDSTLYQRDTTDFAPGFEMTSIKISGTQPGWHSINHSDMYAVSTPYSNMSASAWLKTEGAIEGANFKIYSVSKDINNNYVYTLLGQSTTITGTTGWTQINLNFIVNDANSLGVYMDIGMQGAGTAWIDAITINQSMNTAQTIYTLTKDGQHTIYYYSTDRAGNVEATKSFNIKLDQTPPGNWHDSGAFRGLFGSAHELWVYVTVEDATSGISVFTDKYQYKTERNPSFGRYSNILDCDSNWNPNNWVILISPPFTPGVKSAYLLAPKTDFCNSNWKVCKTVKFFSEDMAGNTSTKDLCINGPWIRFRGEGIVGSKTYIDMISEPEGDNTDGLIISSGLQIDFFTSTRNWALENVLSPDMPDYDTWSREVPNKNSMGSNLPTNNGVFIVNGNLTINSNNIPSNYANQDINQVIFVDGDLRINTNLNIRNTATVMYVVSGNVEIDKDVEEVDSGIIADGNFYTAYNASEGTATKVLALRGVFGANKFVFQRTSQGADNDKTPSEDFTYEPKYIARTREYLGTNQVKWLSTD